MRFLAALPAGWFPRMEQPIELPGGPAGDSAPEPDVAVVPGNFADYEARGRAFKALAAAVGPA